MKKLVITAFTFVCILGLITPLKLSGEEEVVIEDIKANLFIGDAGEMVESFEITVDDPATLVDLTAEDFDITGNYDGYPLNEAEETAQENYQDDELALSIDENTITLTFRPFKYPGGPVEDFEVVNEQYPTLSFTADDVTSETRRTIDDFEFNSFTGSNGTTLNYRLNLADTGQPEPLMVFMHGGGEVGSDNQIHITSNRGAVFGLEAGKTTNVLSVQFPDNYDWAVYDNEEELATMQAQFEAYYELIQSLIDSGDVDEDRIYVYGISSGGGWTLRFLMQYPDLAAAAITVAPKDAVADYTGDVDAFIDALQGIEHIPHWIIHAETDPITDVRTSLLTHEALETLGAEDLHLTIYDEQTMNDQRFYGPLAHWSWVPVFNDDTILDWLFAQEKTVTDDEQSTEEETSTLPDDNNGVDEINEDTDSNTSDQIENPKTGDHSSIGFFMIIAVLSSLGLFFLRNKRHI
ncbi:prolyl oligopeptidase family serine peptidase [Amphibacillus cookii]|uniref:prolyl oligopeptidase family serine peptidase n=1 Tax=Amphibacillus cookii TaxID=767787 RepID=UPI001958EDD2|nr:prolyl oligopeptidase family serine peptidase [Amphibacillus cookii]MBM7541165.1 pimeloyl-ACP methyl ester carboxylesterase [Amphibacillus cookii]